MLLPVPEIYQLKKWILKERRVDLKDGIAWFHHVSSPWKPLYTFIIKFRLLANSTYIFEHQYAKDYARGQNDQKKKKKWWTIWQPNCTKKRQYTSLKKDDIQINNNHTRVKCRSYCIERKWGAREYYAEFFIVHYQSVLSSKHSFEDGNFKCFRMWCVREWV